MCHRPLLPKIAALMITLTGVFVLSACQDDSDKSTRLTKKQSHEKQSAPSTVANPRQTENQSSLALFGDEICPAGHLASEKSFSVENYCQFGAATSAHLGKTDRSNPFVFSVTKEVLTNGGVKFVTTCYANITCEFQGSPQSNYCHENFKPGSIDVVLDSSARDCKKNLETVDKIFVHEFSSLDANKELAEREACRLGAASYGKNSFGNDPSAGALEFCRVNNKTILDDSELIKCCQQEQGQGSQKIAVDVIVVGMGNVTDDSYPQKINCPDKNSCSAQYLPGSSVKFSALSRIGFKFQRWEQDGQQVCSGKSSCTINTTLAANQSKIVLKAIFDGKIVDAVHLAVDVQGFRNGTVKDQLGLIDCRLVNGSRDMVNSKCNATYNRNQNVTLTALGEDNETKFDKWLQGIAAPTNGDTLSLNMSKDKTVIGYFKLSSTTNDPNPYSLTVKVKGRGKVVDNRTKITCINNSYDPNQIVACSASYPRKVANIPETVTLTATPHSDSSFVRWEGNYTSTKTTETTSIANIDLENNEVITAIFDSAGAGLPGPSSTPNSSSSPNPSAYPSPNATPSVTPSVSAFPSVYPSPSFTATPSASGFPSPSPKPSMTPSASGFPSPSPSFTATPSITMPGYSPTVSPTTSAAPAWPSMPVLIVPPNTTAPAPSGSPVIPKMSVPAGSYPYSE